MSDEQVIDVGNAWSAFADGVRIERHGPVTHLVFSMGQQFAPPRTQRVVTARVILPTELLAAIEKQLAAPPPPVGVLQIAVH